MNQTIRNHYLPQTYLKHFLLDEKLEMYKKGKKFFKNGTLPEERILTIVGEESLKNFGLENHLYDPDVPGISSNDLEDIFNGYGENYYNALIQDIENLAIGTPISPEIKDKICLFIASMRVRTPQFKREIEEMVGSFMKHDMSNKFSQMEPEELVQFYKEIKGKEISVDTAKK